MADIGSVRARSRYLAAAALVLSVGLMAAPVSGVSAQNRPSVEYQLKAVFLYHFTQFVEWSPDAFADAGAPIVIGVFGEDPFGDYLDETVRGETAAGRPIVARRVGWEDLTECHILFISGSDADSRAAVLAQVEDLPVLTVGDAEDFAVSGGMVQFMTRHGRIRLRINPDAARAAGLTLSSKLLSLAEIVTTAES